MPTLIAGAWQVFGENVPVAAAVVAAIAGLCVLVSFRWGWRAGGLTAGLVAAAVVLINAHYLKETIFSLTSPVYGLFLALAVWAFCEALSPSSGQWRGLLAWALAGLAGGAAWLSRPEGPLIPLVLGLTAAYLWWRRRDSGGGARRLVLGFLLALALFIVAASPLIAYNLANYGTVAHATTAVIQWAPDYEARFSITPPTAQAYWAAHTPADYATVLAGNLVWMIALLGDYLTWPLAALLVIAAVWAVWRASPLGAVVVYTLVYLAASLFQGPASIWPGTQFFMYYSSLLPLWAVLMGWAVRELGPLLWATRLRRRATTVALAVVLVLIGVVEGAQMVSLVERVGRSQIDVADPRLYDFQWMAEHSALDAIVMTWDVENLHWYSDHRRAVMIPADDARTIQAFMRRWGVTHFYYNDWLVLKRPALEPLREALRTRSHLGPYSILQPIHTGEGILFQVDWAGPPALLLVHPSEDTEEYIAQTWLRYAVADTVPADVSAYPAVIANDEAPGLAGRYRPVGARFGTGIELLGYEVAAVQPGEALELTLYWRCVAPVKVDYTVFNHLLDANDARAAQQDDPPAGGLYPTSRWRPGEVIVDRHTIAIPSDVRSGDYQIALGLYEFVTMQRLPVQGGGDTVTLAPITIGRKPGAVNGE